MNHHFEWAATPGRCPRPPHCLVPSPCLVLGVRSLLLPSGTITELYWGPLSVFPSFGTDSEGTPQPALEKPGLGTWLVTKNKCLQVNTVSSVGIKQLSVSDCDRIFLPTFYYCIPDFTLLYFPQREEECSFNKLFEKLEPGVEFKEWGSCIIY